MSHIRKLLASLPWTILLVLCATLGLAPFVPEPHIWGKLTLLIAGELTQPMDIFDLLLHGTPWLLLILKVVLRDRRASL
jgi:hypothetical protein